MTSDDQNHGGSARDEVIAGEYVLGVLSIEERRAVERRMVDDRNFAALVERWQADMAPLNDEYRETVPDPALFGRIERRLFRAEPASSSTMGGSGQRPILALGFLRIIAGRSGIDPLRLRYPPAARNGQPHRGGTVRSG